MYTATTIASRSAIGQLSLAEKIVTSYMASRSVLLKAGRDRTLGMKLVEGGKGWIPITHHAEFFY